MNNDLEKKWRKEFDNKFSSQWSSETDNCGEYISSSRAIAWQVYLSARKAAQVEKENQFNSMDSLIKKHAAIIETRNAQLKDRDQEIERLKIVEFSSHQIELDRNNLLEELKERDDLIKELILFDDCDEHCSDGRHSKGCKKRSELVKKARKLAGENGN